MRPAPRPAEHSAAPSNVCTLGFHSIWVCARIAPEEGGMFWPSWLTGLAWKLREGDSGQASGPNRVARNALRPAVDLLRSHHEFMRPPHLRTAAAAGSVAVVRRGAEQPTGRWVLLSQVLNCL